VGWIENYWFKRRFIYESKQNAAINSISSSVRIIMNENDLKNYTLCSKDYKIWFERLSKDCNVWIIERDKRIVAYAWTHIPKHEAVWHDSLPTKVGEVRIFNVWTIPSLRGLGLAGELYMAIINEVIKQREYRRIWSVVESSNYPSIRLHEKNGFIKTKENWLIKCCGHNIFSIIPGKHTFFLSGDRLNRL